MILLPICQSTGDEMDIFAYDPSSEKDCETKEKDTSKSDTVCPHRISLFNSFLLTYFLSSFIVLLFQ